MNDIEGILRKIIREEFTSPIIEKLNEITEQLTQLKSNNSTANVVYPADMKATLTVKDIQEILGISQNKAYELVSNEPPFRVLKSGRRFLISGKAFYDWFHTENNK